MAQTVRTNLVIPEILADTIRVGLPGVKVLLGSGAAIMNGSLPGDKKGGDTVNVPYFANIGELDDVAEGAALTPVALSATKDPATVQRSGKAIDLTRWAELAALGDPYAEATAQFVEAVRRRADKALIDAAKTTTLVNDDSTNNFNYDSFVDTRMLFGDEGDDIALIACHSAVLGKFAKLKDTQGRPLFVDANNGGAPMFMGVPIKVTDRLAPASGVYQTLFLKKNSLAFWYGAQPSVRSLPDPLKDSDITSVNVYWVAYCYKNMPGLSKPGVAIYKHK